MAECDTLGVHGHWSNPATELQRLANLSQMLTTRDVKPPAIHSGIRTHKRASSTETVGGMVQREADPRG